MSKLKTFNGVSWDTVNGQIIGDTLPIGSIIPFGGTTVPSGWFLCHGQELSRASYPELYAIIGDSFGGDDQEQTFQLPNLKGKTIVGKNSSDSDFEDIGETGGEKTHTLTVDEMPSHSHRVYRSGGQTAGYGSLFQNTSTPTELTANVVENTGGGLAHNNLQPYIVTEYIIKYKNTVGLVGNVNDNYSTSHVDSYSCDYINGIIERGGNANGYYTKYDDGTLICRYYAGPITTNAGAGTTTAVTFPYEFVDTNWQTQITMTNGQAYWSYVFANVSDKSKTGFNLKTWNNGGGTNSGQYFDYVAIGRWK